MEVCVNVLSKAGRHQSVAPVEVRTLDLSPQHRSAIIRAAASLLSGGNRASIFRETAGVSGVMMPTVKDLELGDPFAYDGSF